MAGRWADESHGCSMAVARREILDAIGPGCSAP